jgi:hypothetical protein
MPFNTIRPLKSKYSESLNGEVSMELEEVREEVSEKLLSENKSEKWLSFLALTTVLFAVCATLSSFKEGNNSVDSVLNQTQAANQWSYYQAKSIKSYLYEMQKEKLTLDREAQQNASGGTQAARYDELIQSYAKDIARYDAEKKEISAEARKYEKMRDEAQWRADTFGMAVIFLQMSILLCSLSALMRRKLLWLVGSLVGLVGVFYFANGFLQFLP